MKFTKEDAVENLKRTLTNNGRKPLRMSEKTLNKVVEVLLPKFADDETGLTDFVEAVSNILETVNDNVGNDKSQFIRQWNIEHPEKDPDPAKDPEPAKGENAALAQLREEIAALKAANEKTEKERTVAAKRKELAEKLGEKGIKDSEWVEMFLSEVDVEKVEDVDAKAESILKFYNKGKAEVNPRAVPGAPAAGANDEVPESIKAAKKLARDLKKLRGEEETQ